MKKLITFLGAILVIGTAGQLPAQEPADAAIDPMIAVAAQFDASQLDQLLGPIALYPDALIALILPASAASSDVVLAARFVREGNDPALAENQTWDESVRALARYPDVVKWMDENLAWTKQLGEAFTAQPTEVMNAIQRLRGRAQAAGTLATTPQQQVVVEQSTISIVPTQPDVIYVPYYDPEVVYVSQPRYYNTPYISFGRGYSTGFWLSYNLDWGSRQVCFVNYSDRQRYWRERPDFWRRPYFSNRPGYVSPPHYAWTPRHSSTYASRPNFAPRTYDTPHSSRTQEARIPNRPSSSPNWQNRTDPRPSSPTWQNRTDSRPSSPTWQNRSESRPSSPTPPTYRRDFNGPRSVQSAGTPLPNASFARGATVPATAPTPQLNLANPLPQPMQAPLQPAPTHSPRVPSGSYARVNPPAVQSTAAPRYHNVPAAAPAVQHAPVFRNPAPAVAAPPVQTANAYGHSPRFQAPQAAPRAVAPAAPAAAPAAPQNRAPAANNGNGRGQNDDGGSRRGGRDRYER